MKVKELTILAYKILGKKLNFIYPYFEDFKPILKKANIKISFKAY